MVDEQGGDESEGLERFLREALDRAIEKAQVPADVERRMVATIDMFKMWESKYGTRDVEDVKAALSKGEIDVLDLKKWYDDGAIKSDAKYGPSLGLHEAASRNPKYAGLF